MKHAHILTAGIALLALGQIASADQTIRFTGSTAFRSATVNAIKNSMTFTNAGEGYGQNGTSFTGGSVHYFKGQVIGVPSAGTVTIKCNWSGSVAGIRDVSAGSSISFIADGTVVSSSGTNNLTASVSEKADVAMADNKQTSTTFTSPTLASVNKVGIIPFAFVAGKDTLASVTNITPQTLKALLTENRIPSSLFTNNPADTQYIYSTGRDPFSGTRLVTLAETGFGTLNNVKQFVPTLSTSPGSLNTVTSVALYPATAAVPDVGNDGASSGGTVANFLRYTTTNVIDTTRSVTLPMSFISYVGEGDSYAAVFGAPFSTLTGGDQGNAKYLTYNGVSAFGGVAKRPDSLGITNGSAVVTFPGVTTSAGLVAGQIVTGTGIAPGSTILSVDSTTQVTLDKNATATNAALTGAQFGALLPAAVRNGAYTFWNYEYALFKTGNTVVDGVVGTSGAKRLVTNAIVSRLTNFDYSFSGLADDAAFTVQRLEDGGYVFPK